MQTVENFRPTGPGPSLVWTLRAGNAKDDAYVNKVAQANVAQAMKDIREKSPTIKAQLNAGTVGLVGAIYDVSTGKVTFLPD